MATTRMSRTSTVGKRLVAAALVALLAWPQPSQAADDWRGVCNSISEFAVALMTNRQQGVSMRLAMATVAGNEEAVRIWLEGLIVAAYEEPRHYTAETQQRAVEDFRDAAYLGCIKSAQKAGL